MIALGLPAVQGCPSAWCRSQRAVPQDPSVAHGKSMPTGWGDQLQRGSGAQYFPLPKEPIAVCVRKPDGSVSLLAL